MQEIVLMSQCAPYIEIWQRDAQDITAWHYRHDGPGEIVEITAMHRLTLRLSIKDWISRSEPSALPAVAALHAIPADYG
jgi:hypothetical protein